MATTAPAFTIEALPAAYGDAIVVTCALEVGEWRLLVDTGTDECWPGLQRRLAQIPLVDGARLIDLAVVSHIDHDHIGAARTLFDDRSLALAFGDIWFNAPPQRASRGVAEGQSLATLLGGARRVGLPWNKAFGGQPAVTTAQAPFLELPSAAGAPRITLLSPTPATLAALFKVWDRELANLGKSEAPPLKRPRPRGALLDLEELASQSTPLDRAPANGSSIAVLLEHRGRSLLLGADAYATVLAEALRALAKHRGVALPWQLDVFKLSHHASSANITVDLFTAAQAQHYIVSTNGAIFDHPDDEAIARVIVNGGKERKLHFNYHNERSAKWDAAALRARYGYVVELPADDKSGVRLVLDGKRTGTNTPGGRRR